MDKIKLPKKDRDQWLEALRSGNHKQVQETLFDEEKGGYCCLGLYCALKGVDEGDMLHIGLPYNLMENLDYKVLNIAEALLGDEVTTPVTLSDKKVVSFTDAWKEERELVKDRLTEDNFANFLASLNDTGMTFVEIADVIEETTVGV